LFEQQYKLLEQIQPMAISGTVWSVAGLTVLVEDFPVPVGAQCRILRRTGPALNAEVVGFDASRAIVMPYDELIGVSRGDVVLCQSPQQHVGVGDPLLGRVIDAMGQPLDDAGPIHFEQYYPLINAAPPATKRKRITEPMSTGIRAIDALLTTGRGQRMGIFAGTGVGKSVLLGMIARYTAADVAVIALIGERGREVRDFLERDLTPEGRRRAVVVVSTSDQSPLLRIRAGFAATAVAEYFRDQGKSVLLLVDSITRLAMAQRQVGLAAGEPPATKGYPPSVFAMLPKLLERAGQGQAGSITGFYTVLVEGDDITEPISDAVRGIIDGHVWLARSLANKGHYPAISLLESVSRIMPDVVDKEHLAAARRVQRLMAIYSEVEDLVNIGAYVPGSSEEVDLAIQCQPFIQQFLQQQVTEGCNFAACRSDLMALSQRIDEQARRLRENSPKAVNASKVA